MEFKFNVNDVFKQPIVEINNNLIPPGFSGDRRALWDSLAKITEIVNTMGEASAAAQGLSKPITTADRLRNSEHKLYLLIDQSANHGKGAVTGMLKTGKKGLYVFDKNGQHYQVTPPCVLDFYVHESRQRNGLGKQLFEHMLQKEEIQPVKMAIDRPSEKLLGFLNKHYTLNSPVKQMNNYVVFDGFFPKSEETGKSTVEKKISANGLQKFSMPQGRYGAPRPPCSMGQIIHNQTTNQEPTGVKSLPATNYQGNPNGPYPNTASQSTPNMGKDQRILSNMQNQNFGDANLYGNYIQHGQVPYNVQNTQQNMGTTNKEVYNQNPIPNMYNNRQYNNVEQPTVASLLQNQNVTPSHPPNSQNMFNNQYVTDNYSSGNMTNPVRPNINNALNNQQNVQHQRIINNSNVGNEMFTQQQMQYNNLKTIQHINNPQISRHNIVGSQNIVNSPVIGNQQHQEHQGMIIPHQEYTNVNQQFRDLNLNNQVSASTINEKNTAPSQFPSNTLSLNNNMVPKAQDQTLGQNNYSVNNPNNPIAQYPIQNVSPQNLPNTERSHETLSYHNVTEPHLNTSQNAQQNTFEYQQNLVGNIPQLHSNPSIQQNTSGYQQNLAGDPVLQSSGLHNIPLPQILPPQQHENYNIPQMTPHQYVPNQHNSEISNQSVLENNTSQPIGNNASVPPIYNNQMYSSQNYVNEQNNLNLNTNKQSPQDSGTDQPLLRPVSSVKVLSNMSNVEMSRHNIINESNSAPMINNAPQGNNSGFYTQGNSPTNIPNAFEGNAHMANSAYIKPGQDVNEKKSKQDLEPTYEEGHLIYGYPPQFTNDTQDDDELHFSSKLERPQSLSIQKSEDEKWEIISDIKDSKNMENSSESNLENNLKAVKINENISEELPPSEADDTPSAMASNHLTNQGYFDIKFYHSKLW